MQKLGEMLLAKGLITQEQLFAALQMQGQFGGRVGSNLVELGALSEQQLAQALSEQLKIPSVSAEEVASIPPEVIAKVTRKVAQEYRAVPLGLSGRTLRVAMSDPTDLARVDDLGFQVNAQIKPSVIAEGALNYALERYYGLERQPRFVGLTNQGPPATAFVQLSESTGDTIGAGHQLSRAEFLSVEAGSPFEPTLRSSGELPDVSGALASVQQRQQLLECLRQVGDALFAQAVFLRMEAGLAIGHVAIRIDGRDEAAARARVRITEGSLLHEAMGGGRVIFREQTDDAGVVALCAQLRMPARQLTLIPVLEDRKVVFIGVGQGTPIETIRERFPWLLRVLGQFSRALQILTLREEILADRGQ